MVIRNSIGGLHERRRLSVAPRPGGSTRSLGYLRNRGDPLVRDRMGRLRVLVVGMALIGAVLWWLGASGSAAAGSRNAKSTSTSCSDTREPQVPSCAPSLRAGTQRRRVRSRRSESAALAFSSRLVSLPPGKSPAPAAFRRYSGALKRPSALRVAELRRAPSRDRGGPRRGSERPHASPPSPRPPGPPAVRAAPP